MVFFTDLHTDIQFKKNLSLADHHNFLKHSSVSRPRIDDSMLQVLRQQNYELNEGTITKILFVCFHLPHPI